MRENKYRGRRLDNGEWEYGDLVQFGQKCYTPCKCAIIPGTASGSDPLCKILLDYEVDPATVGQYTGLKDMSGTDIWEGDIMRIPETCFNAEIIGRVLFEEDAYYIIPLRGGHLWGLHWSLRKHNAKIIGNIYDNPELLKTE